MFLSNVIFAYQLKTTVKNFICTDNVALGNEKWKKKSQLYKINEKWKLG